MNCIKCGIELPETAKFCLSCGQKQGNAQSFYNWLAFISYSHKDAEPAKYLESELKKYKLPLIIEQNNPELKKLRFDQIFRDENNFGNGALEDQIQFGLQNSKFLIAICSPNYAKANNEGINWCDEEIKQFLAYHNNDDSLIIPIIIDGVPHSQNECFPPSLLNLKSDDGKTKEALGIAGTALKTLLVDGQEKETISAAEKQAKDEVFDALKARLLGLNYGAYKNYAHQEKYFSDYADVNGIPVGIGELTEEVWKHTKHYKFIYREDLLDEVRYENGNGAVIIHSDSEEKDRIIDSVFFYDEKGSLLKIEERDIHGNVSRVVEFKKNFCVMNFTDTEDDSKNMDADFSLSGLDDGGSFKQKSEVKSVRLVRDEKGFITKKSYHKYHNEIYPVCDSAGIYGIEYKNDENGRVQCFWYLNAAGEHVSAKDGVAGRIYEYNRKGNRIRDSFVDMQGNPTVNGKGYSSIQYTYDDYGNTVKAEYFDIHNQPVINKNGFHVYCIEYDDSGNSSRMSFYGLQNEPVLSKKGFASFSSTFDDKGNTIRQTYSGLNNEPVLCAEGYASVVQAYDSRNYMIQQDYLGRSDEPVLTKKDGVATVKQVYDEKGYRLEGSFFGVDGKPVCDRNGYAKMCFKMDKNGNPLEISVFGTEGQPVLARTGTSTVRITYDDYGNPIERRYYGTDDELRSDKHGCAIIRSVYDSRGRLLQISYYGTDGQRTLYENSYAIENRVYDEQGNIIERSYYGVKEEPVLNKEGQHIVRCKYDKAGNRTELTNFGIHDESIINVNGYFKETGEYDEYGNLLGCSYLGLQGELVTEKQSGFSHNEFTYKRGLIVENRQYGTDGKLLLNSKSGFARCVTVYDDYDQVIEMQYYGFNNEPVLTANGHKLKKVYDARGNLIETSFWGVSGEPVCGSSGYAKVCRKYDNRDNEIERTFYDADGNLRSTFAKETTAYNDQNMIVDLAHYNADGSYAVVDGYCRFSRKYNSSGKLVREAIYLDNNVIRETGYDDEGNKCETKKTSSEGIVLLERFNKAGKKTEEAQFDAKNAPLADENGYSHYFFTYYEDDITLKSVKRCYPDGDYNVSLYDKSRNVTELAYFHEDGSLRMSKNFAKKCSQYDERGNLLVVTYYGEDGQKMLYRNYASNRSTYDERNNCIEYAFFGLNDEPVLNMANRHKWIATYDERNNKITEASYGVQGEPVLQKDGYFRWEKVYDENNQCILTIYYDTENNEIKREENHPEEK